MQRLVLAAGLLLACGIVVPQPVTAEPAAAAAGSAPSAAARVVRENRIDARTLDLEIDSPALGTKASVRLLLPARYDDEPGRTWPVLYLLHGCCEPADYQSWTRFTDVEQFTRDKDVMVVLPSGGRAGMYSKWWNFGLRSTPDWETFHVTELRQLLEWNYRAGQRRAIGGISIGGYGAMAYAFRQKGMFQAAASYSGIPNTLYPGTPAVIKGILIREGFNPLDLWGHEIASVFLWSGRNPYDHVDDLRGVRLYLSCGNGMTGPLDPPGQGDLLEPYAYLTSKSFTDRLASKGIAATVNYYGAGTHSWPYWQRELHNSWPVLAAGLGLPV